MDFGSRAQQQELRDEVARALMDPAVQRELRVVTTSGEREPDVRALYRELGRCGLLAVGWPTEYGGRGASQTEAATVVEQLVCAGVPDLLQVLTIQIVGAFLLLAGSEQQKADLLPRMAAGERFATVLYTEPEAGSDIASLSGTARRTDSGYLLNGTKVYGLKSSLADHGLCAMRTGEGPSKYDGISLFLVDLTAEGVRRGTIASLPDEQFDRIELTEVRVGPDALVGTEGAGWPLLDRCLAIERTGLTYALKARHWYETALTGLDPDTVDDSTLEQVGRGGAAVAASQLIVAEVLSGLDRGAVDEAVAAGSKYHASETAQTVAIWAASLAGFGYGGGGLTGPAAAELESGYREAAGLTIAAGASPVMLEIVAASGLDLDITEGNHAHSKP